RRFLRGVAGESLLVRSARDCPRQTRMARLQPRGSAMSQVEGAASQRTRIALVNDYEIVLRGVESMLRPFRDRVEVVEIDVERNPDRHVDVALFDTYGHPRLGLDRIASLARDPHVRAVAVYTWSFTPERFAPPTPAL